MSQEINYAGYVGQLIESLRITQSELEDMIVYKNSNLNDIDKHKIIKIIDDLQALIGYE